MQKHWYNQKWQQCLGTFVLESIYNAPIQWHYGTHSHQNATGFGFIWSTLFRQICKIRSETLQICTKNHTKIKSPWPNNRKKNTQNINCENNHAHMLTLVFFLLVFMCVGQFCVCDVRCALYIFIQYTLVGYCLHVETGFKRMNTFAVNIELNPVTGKYQQISLRIVYVSSNWDWYFACPVSLSRSLSLAFLLA